MSSNFPSDYNVSLFTEIHTTVIAFRVHGLLNAPVDWSTAQYSPNYLDMVKVRYRTFYIECVGNKFEVVIGKRGDDLCFTHGWSEVPNCYFDDVVTSGWASLTYIRPRLSRSQFGEDQYPIPGEQIRYPYRHDDLDFTHIFVVTLTESDIHSGYLTMGYQHFASKLFARNDTSVKLVDDVGLEWMCTVEYVPPPADHIKLGGKWLNFMKARKYKEGTYLMFGTRVLGRVWELFVKER
ncbi:hypothetical protein TSUD_240560 [Trifolium subterraneum]|uniref:Uncharacterized protein n=1 Tax=Trifolium subterraneum TaxID=3900 RepID=A0A2Z6PSK4_TRISU|nr:hypothetical protein TSUD_240560 [Trifolium subterraneum]